MVHKHTQKPLWQGRNSTVIITRTWTARARDVGQQRTPCSWHRTSTVIALQYRLSLGQSLQCSIVSHSLEQSATTLRTLLSCAIALSQSITTLHCNTVRHSLTHPHYQAVTQVVTILLHTTKCFVFRGVIASRGLFAT